MEDLREHGAEKVEAAADEELAPAAERVANIEGQRRRRKAPIKPADVKADRCSALSMWPFCASMRARMEMTEPLIAPML